MTSSSSLLILLAWALLANSAILPFSITSPYPNGQTAVDNSVLVTSNGCGSGPTQAKLAKNLIPFLTVLTPAAMAMTSVTEHVSHPTTWQYLMAVATPQIATCSRSVKRTPRQFRIKSRLLLSYCARRLPPSSTRASVIQGRNSTNKLRSSIATARDLILEFDLFPVNESQQDEDKSEMNSPSFSPKFSLLFYILSFQTHWYCSTIKNRNIFWEESIPSHGHQRFCTCWFRKQIVQEFIEEVYLFYSMAIRSCLLAIVVLTVVTNSAIIPATIASPCPAGKTAYANSVPVTSNGCGSGPTQVALASYLVPYLNDFTPCCNAHDICFGTCAISNFLAAFNTCNSSFKTCMYSKCAAKARAIWNPITAYLTKSACETTASLLYNAVNSLGKGIYVSSQKLHCSCK